MNGPLYNGNTVVLLPRWDRVVAAECVQRYRVASWTAVPTMIQDFFQNPNIEHYDLSSIRRLSGGGAAIPAGAGAELAEGKVGEIGTHGPQVFLGYWNKPQDSAQAFIEIDGKRFLRTGDLGRVDEDGYFFMVDRLN